MKAIGAGLKAHLAQTVTTLATCWQIIRTDGASFAFTSLDEDLVVGGVRYISTAGFSRSAIQSGSSNQVDNVDVEGFFAANGITEADLKNHKFDFATVYLFSVNWANLSQGIIRLRRGTLGQTVYAPSGQFQAELRGLTQALTQEFGNIYQPICRADLGDSKCKMPIVPGSWAPGANIAADAYIRPATQTTDALLVSIFQAENGGATGATEPAWNTAFGATTVDGGVTWVSRPYWRGLFTVASAISQRSFVSAPLSIPAAGVVSAVSAQIQFRNNVSAGTTIEVTDGITSVGWTTAFDLRGSGDRNHQDAVHYVYDTLKNSSLNMAFAITSGSGIQLTNNSGQQGDITKTGDVLGGVVIVNFGGSAFDGGTITWLSGLNAGTSVELKSYNASTNVAELWLQTFEAIAAGDRFFFYPPCDKRRDTCRLVFNNIVNFRGEPDMQGTDMLMQYPDTGD